MAIQRQTDQPARAASAHPRAGRARELGTSPNGATALDERLARGLGWFSIGLGLAELAVPGGVAAISGVPRHRLILRTYGMRELASGVGILMERRPTTWLWSRVAGDVLDLASLALALGSPRARRGRIIAATAAVAGVTALDVVCARRLGRDGGAATMDTPDGVHVRTSITVNRGPEDVYRFWRDFTNLPRVMRHLEGVQLRGERRSHWVARAPGGMRAEWDAELVDDRPNELISWRALPGGDIETEGVVRFVPAPGGRGTEVHLDMIYRAPGGLLASTVGRFFGGSASTLAAEDLRPLKQLLETGEIPTTDGSPSARLRDVARGGRKP